MALEQDFVPFAAGAGANVLTQAQYLALSALASGYTSGVAQSAAVNKNLRQSSIIASVLAQFIVNNSGQPAIDDGTTATLLSNLTAAVSACARQNPVLADTGSVNAYAVANAAAFTAYPTVSGLVLDVSIAHTNTGASTLNVDGLGTKPIYGLGLQALQGGELVVNGVASLMYVIAPGVNSGNGAWVILECTGGAQQVTTATQSQHALPLGQATGRLLRVTKITSTQTFTPGAGTTAVKVRLVGGGGSGAGAPANNSSQSSLGAAGPAGAYAEGYFTSGFSGVAVIIGGGGAGATGNASNGGGSSSFGALLSCTGGGGASTYQGAAPIVLGGPAGGSATGSGYLLISGASGSVGVLIAAGTGYGGSGAPSYFGSGGGSPALGSSGISATAYGAGGSGVAQGPSGAALTSGAGAPGVCIIEEYGSV